MRIAGKGSKDLTVEFGGWRHDERVIQSAIAMTELVPLLHCAHYPSPPRVIDHHLASPPILVLTDSHHLSRDLQVGQKCQECREGSQDCEDQGESKGNSPAYVERVDLTWIRYHLYTLRVLWLLEPS